MLLTVRGRGARLSFAGLALMAALAGSRFTEAQNRPSMAAAPLALQGEAARGGELATTCEGCHAIPGYRNAYPSYRVPKLGGQNADYLEVALLRYRSGDRAHLTMQAQAATLSDQDIADLVAYLASFEGEPQTGVSGAGTVQITAGRSKASACGACHGDAGEALAPLWPHLAGQHASYLEQALLQYQQGARSDAVMVPLVAALSEQDIRDLAAFYSAQRGLYTTAR